jgi:Flp pilus assembly protein TadD
MPDVAPAGEPAPAATPAPGRAARWRLPAALVLLTALAYANAAPKVLLYDDRAIIAQGTGLEGLARIPGIFAADARAASNEQSRLYRPLAMTTIVLDRVIYRGHPRGFHATSILLHVGCTLLLFGLLGAAGAGRTTAFVAALVFGVHPIHTEAVDLAFNRSEILATIGVLGGLWWVWRFWANRRALALAGAALIYLLALFCRESAVTFPALAALMLVLLRPAGGLRAEVRRLAPLALLIAPLVVYLWLRQLALHQPGGGIGRSLAEGVAAPGALPQRLALIATTLRDYLRMLVWPWPLRLTSNDYVVRHVWLAVVVHAAALATALACRRRAPWVAFALGFFYVAIIPSTKLFGDPATLAERFVYLPSAGASFALAAGLGALERRAGTRPVLLAAVALAGAAMPLTLLRNVDFHNHRMLWEAEYAATRDDWQVLLNLSEALTHVGDNARVLEVCARGRQVAPQHPGFHSNAALAYLNLERYADAEREFRAAIAMNHRPIDYTNLARLLHMTRRSAEAEQEYREAIVRVTDPAERHALTGEMLLRCRGDLARGKAELEAALRLQPGHIQARENLRIARRLEALVGASGGATQPAAAASQPAPPRP